MLLILFIIDPSFNVCDIKGKFEKTQPSRSNINPCLDLEVNDESKSSERYDFKICLQNNANSVKQYLDKSFRASLSTNNCNN